MTMIMDSHNHPTKPLKICSVHWNMLRDKIKELGMEHLLAPSGEEAERRLNENEPEPLIKAFTMIASMTSHMPHILDYNTCPICGATRLDLSEDKLTEYLWIDGPIRAIRTDYINRGILSNLSHFH